MIENRQKRQPLSFLKKLDIFGIPIQLNFNKENKHTTRLGGFVSLSIFGVLMMILVNLWIKIQNKSNPSVLSEQVIVQNPSRFNLTDENFSFAITLLDDTYQPFFDESYYTIKGDFLYKVDVVQSDGTITQDFKQFDLELQRCRPSNFQVKGTEDYFLSQMYKNMYCINNVSTLYLVGQFEMSRFSAIQLYVQQCQGLSCQDTPELERKLKKTQLQIYFTNNVVQIQNYQQPFQPIGQSNFWETNLDLPQVIDFMYMNTYVKDDLGLITSDERTQMKMLFSSTRTMPSSQTDSGFYRISLFMEKNRELVYQRSFLTLTEAISQVGGIYNVFFFLGCILAQPYSYIELQRKLVNSTFQFSKQYLDKKKESPNKSGKKSKWNVDKKSSTQNKSPQEINRSTNNNTDFTNPYKKENILNGDFILGDKTGKGKSKQPTLDEIQPRKEDNEEGLKIEVKSNIFKTVFNEFKVRSKEYFTNYMRCFQCYQNDIKMVLRYGTSKVFEFTDICYIINKLIEVEKIKHLILNEQQLKLFEYVPKPKITKSIIDSYRNTIEKDTQTQQAILAKTEINLNIENKIRKKSTNQLNILAITNRSQLEKAHEAQRAYNKIYKQQVKLSKIDKKLQLLLDKNHIPLFNNDSFDNQVVKRFTVSFQNCHNNTATHSISSPEKKNFRYRNNQFEQKSSPNNIDDIFNFNNEINLTQTEEIRIQEQEEMQSSQQYSLNIPKHKFVKGAFPTLNLDYDASFKDIPQNIRQYNYKKSSLQDKN